MPLSSLFRRKSRQQLDETQERGKLATEDNQLAVSVESQLHLSVPEDKGSSSNRIETLQPEKATGLSTPSSHLPRSEAAQPNSIQQIQNLLTLPQFEYPPLPSGRHIRLLELAPKEGGSFVRCRLLSRELTPDLKYNAISYCWDDPSVPELPNVFKGLFPVECNNALLLVNSGLVQVLTKLPEKLSSGFIWADGICINQDDLAERAHQVSLMHHIYANAERVLVWLGSDQNDNAAIACELIHSTVTAAHEYHAVHGEFPVDPRPETMRADIFKKYGHRGWSPVYELYSLKWFTRVWTQQEIGLAKNAICLWGYSGIRFDYIIEFACLRKANLSPNEEEAPLRPENAVFFQFLDIWCQYEAPDSWESKLPCTKKFQRLEHARPEEALVSSGRILRLLQTGRTLHCTDPRDRIFAFLGHPAARVSNSEGPGTLIKPDYEASKDQIYITVAKKILIEMASLMLLSSVVHQEDPANKHSPSWVPQWDDETSLPQFGLLLPGRDLYYDASKSKESRSQEKPRNIVSFHIDSTNVLEVTGLKFDRVERTCGPFTSEDFERATTTASAEGRSTTPFANSVAKIMNTISSSMSHSSPTPYPSVDLALACTLVMGLFVGGIPAESRPEHLLASFHAYLRRGNILSDSRTQESIPEHAHNYPWGVSVTHRKFFVTSNGYFGAGPAVMQEGDVCCVLFGSRVPFVLREAAGKVGRYRLVGETFVQGIMRGEMIDRWKQEELKEETFKLV